MDDASRLANLARAAADRVKPGMTLGLGSGSTAEAVIRELGHRVAAGLSIRGVATSRRTAELATACAIPLLTMEEIERLDLGIDGADEIVAVAGGLAITKGRGGALLHEKLVALACDDYLIVAAAEKVVPQLGTRTALPVEVIAFGWRQTAARLSKLGCHPALRVRTDPLDPVRSDGEPDPFVSDSGHYILDCTTGPIADPLTLGRTIKATTGVVDHGLFLGIAPRALVVDPDGTVRVVGANESTGDRSV